MNYSDRMKKIISALPKIKDLTISYDEITVGIPATHHTKNDDGIFYKRVELGINVSDYHHPVLVGFQFEHAADGPSSLPEVRALTANCPNSLSVYYDRKRDALDAVKRLKVHLDKSS